MPLNPKSVLPNSNSETALWRRHFPIDADADTSHSRREFIGGITAAGGAMACGQVALNYVAPVSRSANTEGFPPFALERKLSEISVGEAISFHYPDERSPCLLVRTSGDEFVAYAQKCTHLACPVIPHVEKNEFHCPCHHGAFDMQTGAPVAGPPRSPLPRLCIDLATDGTLTVVGFSSQHGTG